METLFTALANFVVSGWNVIAALLGILIPWLALFIWITFWMLAVDWRKLRPLLVEGGWIGLVLIGFGAVLVWGTVAPPEMNYYQIGTLMVSNYVGKTVFVTALICLALLAGSVQLSGFCDCCCHFEEDPVELHASHDHGHGHDHDQGHGHAPAHDAHTQHH